MILLTIYKVPSSYAVFCDHNACQVHFSLQSNHLSAMEFGLHDVAGLICLDFKSFCHVCVKGVIEWVHEKEVTRTWELFIGSKGCCEIWGFRGSLIDAYCSFWMICRPGKKLKKEKSYRVLFLWTQILMNNSSIRFLVHKLKCVLTWCTRRWMN